MPDSGEAIAVKLAERIDEIGEAAWDSCAGRDNPFLIYAFLHALEASNSASAETGWLPQHLVAEDCAAGSSASCRCISRTIPTANTCSTTAGRMPIDRAGGRYYPKLQVVGPVHAGQRPAHPGRRAPRPRRDPRRADRRPGQGRGATPRLLVARDLLHRRGSGRIRRSGVPDPVRVPVPLGKPRLSQLRRFPRGAEPRQAQIDPQGAPRRRRPGRRGHRAERC